MLKHSQISGRVNLLEKKKYRASQVSSLLGRKLAKDRYIGVWAYPLYDQMS